jgi:HEAT repeat protein
MTAVFRRPYQDLETAIEDAIPKFLSLLKDEDSNVREAAVLAIIEFSKQRNIDFLVHAHALTYIV